MVRFGYNVCWIGKVGKRDIKVDLYFYYNNKVVRLRKVRLDCIIQYISGINIELISKGRPY